MKDLLYLPVIPEGVNFDKKTIGLFNYTLSDDFLIKGDPILKNIEVWADKVSIKAIRVTFSNGNTTLTTKTYGISNTTTLSKLTKSTKSFPSSMQVAGTNSNYLKSNTPLSQIGGA